MKEKEFRQEYLCERTEEGSDATTRRDVLSWLKSTALHDPLINNIMSHYKHMSWHEGRNANQELHGYHFNDLLLTIIKMQQKRIQEQDGLLLQYKPQEEKPVCAKGVFA